MVHWQRGMKERMDPIYGVNLDYRALKETDKEMASKLDARPATPEQQSKIENLKAEGPVIEWMIQDLSPDEIVGRLNDIYPDANVKNEDIQYFVDRHQSIVNVLIKSDKKLLKRHLDANFAFRDKLIQMQETAHSALEKAARQEDYSAIAALQNSILKNIQLFAKMGGLLEPEGDKVQINIIEQVSSALSQEHAVRKKRMLESASAVDIKYEIHEDEVDGV